jgi:hypothetical protein
MNRRDALKATGATLGSLLLATNGVLAACGRAPRRIANRVLDLEEQDLVEAMADTLFPATPASPGAKAANAGPEINLLVTDCYDAPAQRQLKDGLVAAQRRALERGGKPFAEQPSHVREDILRTFDSESHGRKPSEHWFPLFRELVLRSYFSSEIGMTKALRFQMEPGRWAGCVPLQPGQPAWG